MNNLSKNIKKILVIQTAFIGDVVLATALLEQLHQVYAASVSIDILVRKGNEALFHQHPFVRQVLIWNKDRKYFSLFELLKKIRKEKYDWVINLQRFASTGSLTAFSGASKTSGFRGNVFSLFFTHTYPHIIHQGIHEIERNAALLALPNLPLSKPRLYPPSSVQHKIAQEYKMPYVCVAPASVWFTKQLPLSLWKALFKKIPAHFQIYILGGKSDEAIAQQLMCDIENKQIISLCGKLSFLESAQLMKNAAMNYVNDSGPMHLASAVNAPVVAFFCSTVPEFGFRPLSDKHYIVQSQKKLDCRPCGLHGKKYCPKGHFDCAYSINIADIPVLD